MICLDFFKDGNHFIGDTLLTLDEFPLSDGMFIYEVVRINFDNNDLVSLVSTPFALIAKACFDREKNILENIIDGNKSCNSCNFILPYLDFHKNSGNADGYATICKQCAKLRRENYIDLHRLDNIEYQKTYRVDTVDIRKFKSKVYYALNNEELLQVRRLYVQENLSSIRSKSREYYNSHKEARVLYSKEFYLDHKDSINERRRLDRLNNPDKYKEIDRIAYAKRKAKRDSLKDAKNES